MQATDAFWHLANFFAPAVVVGGLAAAAASWGGGRAGRAFLRLWAWASGAAALASIAGLLVFAHDGKVATYAAMVGAVALALWWAQGGRSRR